MKHPRLPYLASVIEQQGAIILAVLTDGWVRLMFIGCVVLANDATYRPSVE